MLNGYVMHFKYLFLLCAAFITIPVNAKADSQPSHEEAINQMSGVMYLHAMSVKCPFPKNVAEYYDIIAMAFVPTLPRFSQEEIAATSKKIEERTDREISISKEKACSKALKDFETLAAMFEKTMNSHP